jgi:hypothetical protein
LPALVLNLNLRIADKPSAKIEAILSEVGFVGQ